MRTRKSSPRAVRLTAVSDVNSSPSTTQPADIVATLLLNVPACGIESGFEASKRSSSSARPANAPKEKPPAKYLPKVAMSGRTPSRSARPEGRGARSSPRR